ncbi:CDGSH iron-sulfur domain-containing protein 2 isoform X2 [Python bivittatus]|uniref:CDGSH iron-sulfur domain-containing protein 2 n=1 Tax=Python bivittatus TaxID=176946 RepID=A0A9F5ILQ7_PYTBI|nr:CDGSH iron-sulfur domain-containing protein 2 isoform X2 [Python bivittatus]
MHVLLLCTEPLEWPVIPSLQEIHGTVLLINRHFFQGKSQVSEWLRLLPFLGVLALLGYLAIRPFLPKKKQQKDSLINLKIQKENPKVVNEINIEDLCHTKAVYCRCWRSKTFPVCDGSHNKHNESTGDNVGPLILRKKEV